MVLTVSATDKKMEVVKDGMHRSRRNYKIITEERIEILLDANLWNMMQLLFHSLDVPLNFEVFVQTEQPKLLKAATGFNAFRDCCQLGQRCYV
uniref:Uncharacterized protein n=1 Tax=Arundo donax TaxID=35708 RepID=A0A0A9FMD9_ARUDO